MVLAVLVLVLPLMLNVLVLTALAVPLAAGKLARWRFGGVSCRSGISIGIRIGGIQR